MIETESFSYAVWAAEQIRFPPYTRCARYPINFFSFSFPIISVSASFPVF